MHFRNSTGIKSEFIYGNDLFSSEQEILVNDRPLCFISSYKTFKLCITFVNISYKVHVNRDKFLNELKTSD